MTSELLEGCKTELCMASVDQRRIIGGKRLSDGSSIYYYLKKSALSKPGQQLGYFKPGMKTGLPVAISSITVGNKVVQFNYSKPIFGIGSQMSEGEDSYLMINSDSYNMNEELDRSTYNFLQVDPGNATRLHPVFSYSHNPFQSQVTSLEGGPGNMAYEVEQNWCLSWKDFPGNPDSYHYEINDALPLCKYPLGSLSGKELELDNYVLEQPGNTLLASMFSTEKKGVRIVYQQQNNEIPKDILDLYDGFLRDRVADGIGLKFQSELYRKVEGGYQRTIAFSTDMGGNSSQSFLITINTSSHSTVSPSENSPDGLKNPVIVALSAVAVITTLVVVTGLVIKEMKSKYKYKYEYNNI